MYKIHEEKLFKHFKKIELSNQTIYECITPPCWQKRIPFRRGTRRSTIYNECFRHLSSCHTNLIVGLIDINKTQNDLKTKHKKAVLLTPTSQIKRDILSSNDFAKNYAKTNSTSIETPIDSVNPISELKAPVQHISVKFSINSVESLILDFFIENLRPLAVIEDKLFTKMLKPVFNSVCPVTKPSVENIINKYASLSKNRIKQLIGSSIINLKFDLLVERQFIIMAIHAINDEISTVTLCVNEISLQMDYKKFIKMVILETLNSYTIKMNQILSLSADIEIRSFRPDEPAIDAFVKSFRAICDNIFQSDIVRIVPAMRIIRRWIKKVLNSSDLNKHLRDCRNLINQHNNDPQNQPIFLDTEADWESTLTMVEQIIMPANKNLTAEQLEYLKNFVTVFQTIQKTCAKFQGSPLIFSDNYIILMELKFSLIRNNTPIANIIGNALNLWLDSTFSTEPLLLASIYLDPRIRICLNEAQVDKVKAYLKNLYKTMFINLTNVADPAADNDINKNLISTSSNSVFLEYLDSISTTADLFERTIDYEFSKYEFEIKDRMPIDSNIVQFWQSQKSYLAEMARAIMTIPITQSTAERNVIALNYMISNKLTSFKDVQNILLLNFNRKC